MLQLFYLASEDHIFYRLYKALPGTKVYFKSSDSSIYIEQDEGDDLVLEISRSEAELRFDIYKEHDYKKEFGDNWAKARYVCFAVHFNNFYPLVLDN